MPYSPNYAAGDILTAAAMNSIGEAWSSTGATWTSSGTAPTLGNGVAVMLYQVLNKTVFCSIAFAMGSTSTYGTGTYYFDVPSSYPIKTANMPSNTVLGQGHLLEQQTNVPYPVAFAVDTSARIRVLTNIPGTGGTAADYVQYGNVSATAPFTWSNSGTVRRATIRGNFFYETT